ncbi:hypothetical protein [Fundidesulfovibrio putealis]|uniref:hypothetical protein n=1 Tax=Fundidesulfovibrio putealis TaxID=270496 RepID=UPI0004136EFB|nr:hypothetical protein [Fundidesulfovibrio putealis]
MSEELDIQNDSTNDATAEFTQSAVSELFPEFKTESTHDDNDDDEIVEQKEEIKEPETKVEQPKTETFEAPAHWSTEMKEAYNSLNENEKKGFIIQAKNLESGYQRKYQDIAKEKEKILAFQGLVEQFQTDKEFAQHILNYSKQEPKDNNYGLGERPVDPYDAIRYDSALEAKKAVQEEISKLTDQQKQDVYKEHINKTIQEAQSDPLYAKVQEGIFKYIESQPAKVQEQIAKILDSDVDAYKEVYLRIRNQIDGETKSESNMPNGVGKEKAPQAPILEKSGAVVDDVAVKTKQQKKSEAKAQAIKGNWAPYLSTLVEDLGFGK